VQKSAVVAAAENEAPVRARLPAAVAAADTWEVHACG